MHNWSAYSDSHEQLINKQLTYQQCTKNAQSKCRTNFKYIYRTYKTNIGKQFK